MIGLSCFYSFNNILTAQNCNNDSSYFSVHYQGPNNNYFFDAGISPQNELVGLGNIYGQGNFVTKFTQQGNVIWSYQYQTNYTLVSWMQYPWYSGLEFSKIAMGLDSFYYVTGLVIEHGETINNGETPPSHKVGVLMKIDKFGKVIWGKTLGAWYTDYSIENIIVLSNGDLLIYLVSFESIPVNRIIRLTKNGNIIWATPLVTQWPSFSGATHAMKELSNGNIVVGDEVYRDQDEIIPRSPTGLPPPIIIPAPIYYLNLFGLDKNTGNITWNSNYRYAPDSSFIPAGFIPDIKNINELPNGDLSFLADLYVTDSILSPYTEKAVNIITDNTGNLMNIIGYSLTNNLSRLINAQDVGSNGEQLLLTQDNTHSNSILTQIDKDGHVEWSKGFASSNTQLTPSYLIKNNSSNRYSVLLSNYLSPEFQLLITDKSGNLPCLDFPVKMIASNVTWQWELDKISFSDISEPIDFGTHGLELTNVNYSLRSNIDCQNNIPCCKDIIDSSNITQVSLCQGSSFTLPDSTIVSDSGRYYVSFKTPKGCDSTVFYNVSVSKNPKDLMLVQDTCFGGKDSLILHATDSFATYNWMNNITTQSYYNITKPGIYWVSVSNICGVKTDSVWVYEKCAFAIEMPNAFTPNGDGKNDVFRIPPLNKNHLVQLIVYNRWGQMVFATTDFAKGWDGVFKGQPQPAGTYVYSLTMTDLTGKQLNQKGTVILIR